MSETEYDLEPSDPESVEEPEPPTPEPARYVPGQPLPRLWKTEPDPPEEEDQADGEPDKKRKKKEGKATPEVAPAARPKAAAPKPPKPRKKTEDAPAGEKKALLEETPRFDTIEARQRARMVMGGLMVFCLLILGWVVYGMIFGGSSDLDLNTAEVPPQALTPVAPTGTSREPEARYMLDRARDYARRKQTDAAVAMVKRIISVYKGTQAAGEAQVALDRTRQRMPLFPEGPYLLAKKATDTALPPTVAVPRSPVPAPARTIVATAGTPTNPAPGILPPQVAMPRTPPPTGLPPQGSPAPSTTMVSRPQPPAVPTSPTAVGVSPVGPASAPPSGPAPTAGPPTGATVGRQALPTAASGGQGLMASPPPSTGPAAMPTTAANLGPPAQPRAPAPPPGPGDAATLIPGNAANPATVTPPPSNGQMLVVNDRGATRASRPARTLPPGFKPRPEAGVHESGWPLVIVGERDGANMVLVPGGTFMMGSDRGEPNNRPSHAVRLSTYYIDQHEVTNRQFRAFLQETQYRGQPPGKWLSDARMRSQPDEVPAVFVSYQDAEEYALWALKRLPTEAQWEMAARAPDGRRYPWGDEPVRWNRPRRFQQLDAVMSFPQDASACGAFDLAGNAVEWVRDWYDPEYYDRLRDKTTLDPTGPPTKRHGIQRVVKGNTKDWLVFTRQGMDSDRRLAYVGFRCSLAVEGGEASALIAPHLPKADTPRTGNPTPGQGAGNDVPF